MSCKINSLFCHVIVKQVHGAMEGDSPSNFLTSFCFHNENSPYIRWELDKSPNICCDFNAMLF